MNGEPSRRLETPLVSRMLVPDGNMWGLLVQEELDRLAFVGAGHGQSFDAIPVGLGTL
jgi:hypothetical protein